MCLRRSNINIQGKDTNKINFGEEQLLIFLIKCLTRVLIRGSLFTEFMEVLGNCILNIFEDLKTEFIKGESHKVKLK